MPEKIQKLLVGRNGFQLNFGFDFQKASDETQRTVVGFATLDNLDQTGDIVLAKASEEAFSMFRGNIREQHNKTNAVGRMVAFEPAEYFDNKTNTVHKGIRVAVRISEGAEDTWKKCLDGTYSGFSIGGAILEKEPHFDQATGKKVQVITKYRLTELSLVDNPANELANFETVYKALDADDDLEKTFAVSNLFWCPDHSLGAKSTSNTYTCAECGENMAKIGTISDNEDLKEKINDFLSELEINTEGVIQEMPETIKKNADGAEEVSETAKAEEVEAVVETTEETPEVEAEAAGETAAETETEETDSDVSETLAALRAQLDRVEELVGKKAEELVTAKVNELAASIDAKLEKLTTDNADLVKALETKDTKIAELEKSLQTTGERLEQVAGATAMQKSDDVVEQTVEKANEPDDMWGGLFTSKYNLKTSE